MSIVAVITARSGSKRIPRKNIKDFLGKPMLAYAIEVASDSKIFNTVMVSTDSEEIADIARKYGAEVPFMRSAKAADDKATTFEALNEVIREFKNRGKTFDTLCCIYPCVPLLKVGTLSLAYKRLKGYDAVIPVCKYPVPIEWAMKINEGVLISNDRTAQDMPFSNIEPKYFDVGMFYFCRVDKMYEHNSLLPSRTAAYIISANECQDIDTIEDWEMAELKYKIMRST